MALIIGEADCFVLVIVAPDLGAIHRPDGALISHRRAQVGAGVGRGKVSSTIARRVGITAVSALALITTVVGAPPAHAAGIAYVRLAHLSPDTPNVDVYLNSQSHSIGEQIFRGVGYGIMSGYLKLPPGGYTVAMRPQGAPKSQKPVLTTQVSVSAGEAYTVAGVGRYAGLGLKVLTDDLSLPAQGQSKVRIIQASLGVPVLGLNMPDGSSIAQNVAFATTTDYQLVTPGNWNLVVKPADGRSSTEVKADLGDGNVYSLLVLDGKQGLTTELKTDATREGGVPAGAVATGAGGTSGPPWMLIAGVVLLLVVAAGAVWAIRRRAARVW